MKRKLTLTVDREITQRAKRHARRRGKSLSTLVEELLKRETGEEAVNLSKTKFSERWRGKMELRTDKDMRSVALHKRYGLKIDD